MQHKYSPLFTQSVHRTMRRLIVFGIAVSSVLTPSLAAAATSTVFTSYPVPSANSAPVATVKGSDNNIWFLEEGANKVGRITPTGVITEFAIPTPNSIASFMIAGPDGNLWFSEYNTGKIGRVTMSGVITEFSLGSASAQPRGLGVGPDGNVWFAEYTANKIGRITSSGVVTEFAAAPQPLTIITGPGGNLWYSTDQDTIQVMSPTGTGLATHAVSASSRIMYMDYGNDGNVWFTEYGSDQVGYMSASGALTEFSLPTSTEPMGIFNGPDGAVWFSKYLVAKITRITPAGTMTDYSTASYGSGYTVALDANNNFWFATVPGAIVKMSIINNPALPTGVLTTQTGNAVVYNPLTGLATNDYNPASLTISTPSAHGATATNTTNGAITYTPNQNYTGADSFSYRLCSTADPANCNTGTVNLSVAAAGTTPTTAVPTATPTVPDTGFAVVRGMNPKVLLGTSVVAAGLLVSFGRRLRKSFR